MPPADSNVPTPAPVPETPKPEKIGFFAKLFGKKPKENAVPDGHESQTPPAQLSDPGTGDSAPVADLSAPSNLSAPAPTPEVPVAEEMPSMPEGNASDEEEGTPPTLDVPPSVSTEAPKVDEGMAVPPVSGTQPVEESDEKPADPSVPKL